MVANSDNSVTKQSNESLSRKAGIMVISRAITISVQLVSLVVLTRVLSKQDLGILSFLFMMVYLSVLSIGQLALPESIFYFFELLAKSARKNFALLTSRTLFFVSLVGSILIFLICYVVKLKGQPLDNLYWPFMVLILLELPTTPLPNILIAIGQAKKAAVFNIAVGLVQFLALVLPAALNLPLKTIIFSLLGSGVFRFLLSAILFANILHGEQTRLPAGTAKKQLSYSIPLSFAQILWSLNRQIDKYVVAWFLPAAVLAEYIIGAWEIPVLSTIPASVASVMLPKFVAYHLDENREELLELWHTAVKKVSIIIIPLTVLFLLIAHEFIVLLYTKNYIRAVIPFRIYTVILLHRVASYSAILKAIDDTRSITISAILLVVLNIILSIPMVKYMGISGPPTATLIANMFAWAYTLTKISKGLQVSFIKVFPFRFYIKTLTVAVLSAIPVVVLGTLVHTSNTLELLLKVIAYLLVFSAAASFAKVYKKEDWLYLLGWVTFKTK